MLRWVGIAAVGFALWAHGSSVGQDKACRYAASNPKGTVTVTATATETKQTNDLPASCQRALDGFRKHLDAAATITSANGKQLDIFAEAYQAILNKDWKKLNELSTRQRELQSTLAGPKAAVLPNVVDLQKDMEQCRLSQN